MKIMICGSMSFAMEMIEAKNKLEAMGHSVEVPCDTQKFLDEPGFTTDNHEDNYDHCIENDIIRKCFAAVAGSDAILVLNHPKNSINGYIGASTLMEMGLAYHLGKKIFLLNPPPSHKELRHAHEVIIMQPSVLNGKLENLAGEKS